MIVILAFHQQTIQNASIQPTTPRTIKHYFHNLIKH